MGIDEELLMKTHNIFVYGEIRKNPSIITRLNRPSQFSHPELRIQYSFNLENVIINTLLSHTKNGTP